MEKKTAFILFIILILLCAGCRNKSDSSANSMNGNSDELPINIGENLFYSKEQLAEIEVEHIYCFALHKNELILAGSFNGSDINEHGFEMPVINVKIINFTLDRQVSREVTLDSLNMYQSPLSADIDDSGNIWLLCGDYEKTESSFFIQCYDQSGKLLKSIYPDLSGFTNPQGLTIMAGSSVESGFYIYTDTQERSYAAYYDQEGNLLFGLDGINSLFELSGGKLIGRRIRGEKASLFEIDAALRELGKEYDFGVNGNDYYSSNANQFDILEINSAALYGLQLNEGKRSKLIDWSNQGIYATSPIRYAALSGEDLYSLISSDSKIMLYRFAQTDQPPEIMEKKIITLASVDSLYAFNSTINRFNEMNTEYEIQVKIYPDTFSLDMDIVAGIIPDIFYIPAHMPVDRYADKGLFMDLYEFLDHDPDISRDDYLESVLKILETDGKLYSIAESFYISTVVGRTTDVGVNIGWTWDEFHALMAKKPAGTVPMMNTLKVWDKNVAGMSGEDFLKSLFWDSSSVFIDYANNKCYFDTPAFIDIMQAANQYYPSQVNRIMTADDLLDGNVLLMKLWISGFSDDVSTILEARYFGGDITYIGYPTEDGTGGSSFHFLNEIAVSAKSDVKEGAWQYLKYVLTDHQHHGIYIDDFTKRTKVYFPVKRSALLEYAEMGLNPTYGSYGSDIDGFFARTPEQRDIQKIFDLIDSITIRSDSIVGIYQIMEEEIPYYFNGQKPAEEVARIIQNRSDIYMAETE